MKKSFCFTAGWLLVMGMTVLLWACVWGNKRYDLVSVLVMILALAPFLFHFEQKKMTAANITLLAVMSALSVVGRFVFAPIPFFKPVTAVVILAGIYLGPFDGFLCGAVSALVSNFYFGQGPWTPFQMVSWGLVGLIAGFLSPHLKNHKWLLYLFGICSGIFYSCMMDVWTALWADGTLLWSRYLASVATALPVMGIYCISNVLFLLVLAGPIGRKLDHTIAKWG